MNEINKKNNKKKGKKSNLKANPCPSVCLYKYNKSSVGTEEAEYTEYKLLGSG